MLVIAGVSAFVIVAVGAVVQKQRGRSGGDLVVGWAFWAELPSLWKDGCCFTLQCCRTKVGGAVAGSYSKYEDL